MHSISQEPDGMDFPNDVTAALRELRRRGADCPEPELLQAVQADVLPPEIRDLLMRHVEMCPICKSLMESLAALENVPLQPDERQRIWDRVQRGTGPESSTATTRHRARWRNLPLWPWPAAIACAAVLLLFFGAGLFHERRQAMSSIRPPRHSETTPSSTAFRLEKAPVMMPASAVLVFRGANEGAPSDKELTDALAPYESDDYSQAAQRFEQLARKYPQLAEAHFYLGVSRLFLNNNQDAARELEAAHRLAKPPLVDESGWYLALAYQRLGRANDARRLLEGLCHSAGRDAAKACLAEQVLQ